jgi:hypothetical protein
MLTAAGRRRASKDSRAVRRHDGYGTRAVPGAGGRSLVLENAGAPTLIGGAAFCSGCHGRSPPPPAASNRCRRKPVGYRGAAVFQWSTRSPARGERRAALSAEGGKPFLQAASPEARSPWQLPELLPRAGARASSARAPAPSLPENLQHRHGVLLPRRRPHRLVIKVDVKPSGRPPVDDLFAHGDQRGAMEARGAPG